MVFAIQEVLVDPSKPLMSDQNELQIHGGQNSSDLIFMLKSLQTNIIKKLAMSEDLKKHQNLRQLLEVVLPLGFT